MAVAALVRPDRLDKPSLVLAGQPEEEVSKRSRFTPAVDKMLASPGFHFTMKILSHALQCDQSATSQSSSSTLARFKVPGCVSGGKFSCLGCFLLGIHTLKNLKPEPIIQSPSWPILMPDKQCNLQFICQPKLISIVVLNTSAPQSCAHVFSCLLVFLGGRGRQHDYNR